MPFEDYWFTKSSKNKLLRSLETVSHENLEVAVTQAAIVVMNLICGKKMDKRV